MRRAPRIFVIVVLTLATLAACSRPRPPPTSNGGDATATVVVVDAAVVLDASGGVDAGIALLPPLEDHCASTDECGVTSLDLSGPEACCFRCCSMHGGRKSWVDRVETICKGARADCKAVACACPSPPYLPKCIDGRCRLVYPP